MEIITIKATNNALKEKLFPLLLNNVFHVTNEKAFEEIQESGFINSNKCGAYKNTFPQSDNNFGARNGMVCLIDLRQKSYLEAEKFAGNGYYFLKPKSDWQKVVFLLLDATFHKDLKLQARFNPPLIGENYIPMKEICKGTYVPEIECWYPEKITLDKISEALVVVEICRRKS